MIEEWREFHRFYEVSSLGRVRSKDRLYTGNVPNKGTLRKGKILKINSRKSQRYESINLYLEGGKKTKSIHRLVALAFLPNPENKAHVNHIDGDGRNNKLENLEWNTPSENNLHAYRLGLNKSVGEKHPKTSLYSDEVKAIKLLHGVKSLAELSEFFNVSKSTISGIHLGKTWQYLDE